ncbi:MAG TPA: hypothetical protein VL742_19425 [Casimicrobiaceae bacterium]|nr:hypothetical protein [Casimicrobiaceae bacterium]
MKDDRPVLGTPQESDPASTAPARNAPGPASSGDVPPRFRAALLIPGFAGLLVGMGAGLARLAWTVPANVASDAALHGPLMLCGFFGVVIALERAVAIGRAWAYAAPLAAGAGTIAAVAGEARAAGWLFVAGSVVLVIASADIVRRQKALFTVTIALGAACWTVGNALWAVAGSPAEAVPWWFAFLVLTIAGERLELSRFLMPSALAKGVFAAIVAVIGAGLALAARPWGMQVCAAGLVALAAWLAKQDIARRTVTKQGLTRFIAVCLLAGYAWLAVAGSVMLASGGLSAGTPSYDAALHALGLGFVFSMVFGHAPIIAPAVLRVRMPYHPAFYLPLALLHLSLLVRVAGDARGSVAWVRVGGLLNGLALAAFIVSMVIAAVRAERPTTRAV